MSFLRYDTNSVIENDKSVFARLKGKWVCRSPQEITILIIRFLFDKEISGCCFRNPQTILENFLKFLQNGPWSSKRGRLRITRGAQGELRKKRVTSPLVPHTFCFNETAQILRTSQPVWLSKHLKNHRWPKFVQESRDARVQVDAVQAQFKKADRALNEIAGVDPTGEIRESDARRWLQLQRDFHNVSGATLRECDGHVCQAVGAAFERKNQCCRYRCYYPGIRLIYKNDEAKRGSDSKVVEDNSEGRPSGPCAESCIYVEVFLRKSLAIAPGYHARMWRISVAALWVLILFSVHRSCRW